MKWLGSTCIVVVLIASYFALMGRVVAASRSAPDPHTLALDVSGFPPGAVIIVNRVDRTAAAVNAEGILGTSSKHGSAYQQLHFRGSVFERAILARFQGVERQVWLMATLFPSRSAANIAYGVDSGLGNSCDASPSIAVSIPTQTCAYINRKGAESGMYVVGVIRNVDFIVIAFVAKGSVAAQTQAMQDASTVARNEVAHLMQILSSTPSAQPTVSPTAPPVATAVPSPEPTGTVMPPSGGPHRKKPSNARCPTILTDRGWDRVSLRPDLYVGCRVDIAAQVYHTQTLEGAVSYNANLDPDRSSPKWTVFAHDYAATPPDIPDDSWVRITGVIEDSTESYNSVTGAYIGQVPQVKIASIVRISAKQAKRMGAI